MGSTVEERLLGRAGFGWTAIRKRRHDNIVRRQRRQDCDMMATSQDLRDLRTSKADTMSQGAEQASQDVQDAQTR